MQASRHPMFFGGGGEIRAEYEEGKVMIRLKSRGRALQAREGLTKTVRGCNKQVF